MGIPKFEESTYPQESRTQSNSANDKTNFPIVFKEEPAGQGGAVRFYMGETSKLLKAAQKKQILIKRRLATTDCPSGSTGKTFNPFLTLQMALSFPYPVFLVVPAS